MKATISMESLWLIIQSLSLKNKEWLSSKLINDIREEKAETEYISKEEILAGIDAGLKDMKAGRTRPARELLEELRNEL